MLRCLLLLAAGASAEAPAPRWMIGLSGGSTARDGDRTRAYGALAVTRKLGRSYVRLSATRFGSAVRQVDVRLPSTFTLGFVQAGTSFGRWFVDGYAAGGDQHYRPVRTDLGPRPIQGGAHSGVFGAGGDAGYVAWLGAGWSLTPAVSAQYIRSRALREQVGPAGPSEYETRETGSTFGGLVRLDRAMGRDRSSSVGLHVSHYVTTNASAALVSGTRGVLAAFDRSGRQADGWTEFGGSAALRVRRNLYLDGAVSRTAGAVSGDITITTLGARLLL